MRQGADAGKAQSSISDWKVSRAPWTMTHLDYADAGRWLGFFHLCELWHRVREG